MEWTKIPLNFIGEENNPLIGLKWNSPRKADQIAALIMYLLFNHHAGNLRVGAENGLGECRLTYDQISTITGLSRDKISGGLSLLIAMGLISVRGEGNRNVYVISRYDDLTWGKLPCALFYRRNTDASPIFHFFNLRSKKELNALKIYLVILKFRSNETNNTCLSYDKIEAYSGVRRVDIRSALSFLVVIGLINIDSFEADINDFSTSNVYKVVGLRARARSNESIGVAVSG